MLSYSNRNIMSNWKYTYLKISIMILAVSSFAFSQDPEPPEEFEFNISIYQSFYFFLESDIDGQELQIEEDWIASFNVYDETNQGNCLYIGQDLDDDPDTEDCQDLNNDGELTSDAEICVGSYYWDGPYSTVPVMGVDGTRWTVGYMEENELPIFKIYDASEDSFYPAIPSIVYPWTADLNFYVISISVIRDCNEDLGGSAVIDDCGNCSGGNTGLIFNYEDLGCGCYEPAPEEFYEDIDGDGLGYGEVELFCEHPGIGWSENNYDEFPDCYYNIYDCNNDCAGTAFLDDCGVCSGGLTEHAANSDIDCNGVCFGSAFLDECDYCVLGDTGLEPCDYVSEQPDEFYYQQSTLQAFYFIINAYIGEGLNLGAQDWIGVFNDDVCVGSVKYDGAFTTVPAMGDDGSDWTEGYLSIGDFPTFQLWDASQNLFYPVNVDIVRVEGAETFTYLGWYPNYYYNVLDFHALVADCNGVLDGGAYFDSCGDCVGGSTGIEPDMAMDCANVCNGDAYFDNCGACVEGNTGIEPNLDDDGCGCFLPPPTNYFSDFDNDGFGYGEPQGFCEPPGSGWVDNNLDIDPYCFNPDINTSLVDDCGVCEGNNQDLDCSGTCFGNATIDDCGVCNGDGSACNAPIATTLNYDVLEDNSIEIILNGSDPNNQNIFYNILSQPENGTIVVNSLNVLYTPNLNFFGEDYFTYQVSNGEYYSEPAYVYINVSPVNDAPVLESIDLFLEEDSVLDFDLLGFDVDNDSLEYQIVLDPINGDFELSGNNLLYTPIDDYFGLDQIHVTAFDGTVYSDIAIFSISVLPINDPPSISSIDNASSSEGTSFELVLAASDIDSEDLFYSVSVDGNASAYVLDGTLTVSPFSGYNGDIVVTVYVSDGYLTDSTDFVLSVIPVNDPPVLSFIGTQIMDEDSDLEINLSSDDPEGDDLEYSFEISNGVGVLEGDVLTITPAQDYNGDIELTVSVSDGDLSDSEILTINVLPVNDAPYFITSTIENAQENENYIQIIEYGDVDNEDGELTLQIGNSLGWLSVEDNTITGIPSFNNGGEYVILLNLSDLNTSNSIQYNFIVEESNQPPSVSDIAINVNEDESVEFLLLGVDFEGDDITYNYSNPSNGVITGSVPNLTYTPNNNFNGLDSFTYTASDENNDSEIAEVEINVVSVNDIPTAQSTSFDVDGENLNFDISDYISDLDGDELLFNTVPPSESDNTFSTLMGGTIELISDYNFIYTKPDENIAADYAIYKVSDGVSESSIEIITFVVDRERLDSRLAPSALSDNVTIMEDSESDITLIGFDIFGFPQDGTAEIIITQSPSNGTIDSPQFEVSSTNQLAKWVVSYSPNSNFSGNDEIKYKVINPNNNQSESDEGTISISITEVNDAPVLASISNQESNEDIPLDIIVSYSDSDNDIQLSASSSVDGFNFDFENIDNNQSSLTITSPQDYYGISTITINAIEDNGELSVSEVFNLNILPVNDAPVLSLIQDVIIDEDSSMLINLSAQDSDYDNLTFSVISDSDNLVVNIENNLLTISGIANYFGEESITVNVNDTENASDSQDFVVTISSVNDIPTVNDILSNVLEDGIVSIFPEGNDIEDSSLTFSMVSPPENGEVSLVSWFFTYEPNSDYYGSDSFTYVAYDGESYSEEATISITVEPDNDAPILTVIPDQEINEGETFLYTIDAEDIDQDPLVYSFSLDQDIESSINGNLLSIVFDDNFNGDLEVTVSANDLEYSDSETFIITVTPVNDAPIVENPISNLILDEDFETFNIDIGNVFSDVDEDALQYSVTYESDDLINLELGDDIIIINSILNQNGGPVEVTLMADDLNRRLSVSDSFEIFINKVNDAPIAFDISVDVNEDTPQIIFADFNDIDSENSSISVVINTSSQHGSLTVQGQGFSYYPDSNFIGADFFTYRVFDGFDYSEEATVFIYVQPANDPPEISNIEDQQIDEDTNLEIAIDAIDIDMDILTFEAICDNAEILIVDNILTINPEANFNGDISVIVSVSDGEFTDDTEFLIEVLPTNDPPEISDIEDQQINEDTILNINLSASDIDGDQLFYIADSNDSNSNIIITGNLLSFEPSSNFNGDISIIVSVSDGEFTDDTEFLIEVLPTNDPPEISDIEDQQINEDANLEIAIDAVDVDMDSLTFEAYLIDDSNASLVIDNNIITIIPNNNWYGELIVNTTVFDSTGLSDSDSFIVNVIPVNDPPVFISTPILEAFEDIEYSYQLEIADPDSDQFNFYFLMSPDGMEIDSNGLITWTPTEGILSSGFVSIVGWDTENPQSGIDYPSIQEFEILVTPVNDPPMIVSNPNTNAIEDEEYTYQVQIEDIDSNDFIFNLENAPDGMEIDSNGLITWTPTEGILSSNYMTVHANDDEGDDSLYDSQSFVIIVTPVNDGPQIVSTAPTEAMEGSLYEYQIEIVDPDDTEFLFQLIDAPEGMNIDFSTFLLTWTPQSGGIFGPIILKVYDGGEDYAQAAVEEFSIDVDFLSDYITMEFDLHEDNNLISFMGIPDDSSIPSVLEPLGNNANQVITEGLAVTNSDQFGWIGSLDEFEAARGYWVGLDEAALLEVEALPTNIDLVYNLHDGYNLISYIGNDNVLLDDALPDDIELNITDILTEGMAATRHPVLGWIGSLANSGFQTLKGYWLKNASIDNIEFSWVIGETVASSNKHEIPKYNSLPSDFRFTQSTKQAFYFFENIIIGNYEIQNGDWILAFNNNKLVGSRQWFGPYTDVPVMGYDNTLPTTGMCEPSDVPSFKIYSISNGKTYDLSNSSFPAWSDLSTHLIETIDDSIPEKFNMAPAYPNPFNPLTHIEYSIPTSSMVQITIYDLIGRKLENLVNEKKEPGYYHVEWDASSISSGVYLVQMEADGNQFNQKIVLIK